MMPVQPLGGVTNEEIERVFAPYVVEHLDGGDPRWAEVVRRLERKYAQPAAGDRGWVTPDGRRTVERVRTGYEAAWRGLSLRDQLAPSKTMHFEWRGAGMIAYGIGRKRVHLLFLTRVIEQLAPASVAEVGFGYGLNLLVLSMQFPAVRFHGIELTHAGVETARRLSADPHTATELEPFAVSGLRDTSAPLRLDLRQGSADALPLDDKSVDMACTILALEQMERIRPAACRELARVARRWVVMIEPFFDWNQDGHRRDYIARHDYFAGRIDELRQYGLEPVAATADMPNKLTFRAGLVVAAVRS